MSRIQTLATLVKGFLEKKCFPSGPNSGRQGHISFDWITKALKYNIPRPLPHPLHPSKLCFTLLSFTAS
jgi:hypothetical protein